MDSMSKWNWMMDWCKHNNVPPANYYWWNKAEEEYDMYIQKHKNMDSQNRE